MSCQTIGLSALLAFSLACASPCSSAQTVAEPTTTTIVVTAARTEQALADALPSTRVIGRAEIETSQAVDLPALLRTLTAIDVSQAGPLGSQTSLFLRGADSRQTLVLVDGVPFARADFGTASWQHLPLDQIERVEIVRGNHSSVYGAQAIGGVVQIVTRRATKPEVMLAAGSQGTYRASAAAGGAWGEGETGTRLSGSLSWRRTDGWSARDPDVVAGANPDRDPARQGGASLRVEQGWAGGHRTQLSLGESDTRSAYDGFTPGLDDQLTTRVRMLALTTRHALGAGWSIDAEAGQTTEHFDDPTAPQNFGVSQADNRVRNVAATLGWHATPNHDLQFGLESRRDRYSVPGGATQQRSTGSARIGWQARVTTDWQVQAHLRHDDSSDFGSTTTGLGAVAFAFAPGWRASLQVSTAFSAPSFLDQQYADPAQPLKAEHSRQAEAALHWREGAASLRAALFVQRQRDRIDFDPNTFVAGNIARARNEGLELMAQWPIAVGALNAEVTLQNPRNADTGVTLARRSKQALVLGWNGRLEAWELRASLRHVGTRRDSDFSDDMTPARTTFGLGVARSFAPGWRAAVTVDNATDHKRPEVLGYTATPRSVLVSLQGSWR
ncbi:MAG: TonB-dependent receptor [Pseudomonadota bacterium]